MSDVELQIRCQRCGAQMEMRDPAPGMPWRPDQFWVCNACGRHFWSTYPPPNREPVKPAAPPAAVAPTATPAATPAAAPVPAAAPADAKPAPEAG